MAAGTRHGSERRDKMKDKRRDKMKDKRREMKEDMILLKNVSNQKNPPDELAQHVSKKSPSDELFLHFSSESSESYRVVNSLLDSNSIFRPAGINSE